MGTVVGTVVTQTPGANRPPLLRGQRVLIGPDAPGEIAGRLALVDAVSAWDVVVSVVPRTSQGRLVALPHDQVMPCCPGLQSPSTPLRRFRLSATR